MSLAREAQSLTVALAEGFESPAKVLAVLDRLRALAEDLAAMEGRAIVDSLPHAGAFLSGPTRTDVRSSVVRLADFR